MGKAEKRNQNSNCLMKSVSAVRYCGIRICYFGYNYGSHTSRFFINENAGETVKIVNAEKYMCKEKFYSPGSQKRICNIVCV